MSMTVTNVADSPLEYIQAVIAFPDAGQSVQVQGIVQSRTPKQDGSGGIYPPVSITGSPVTCPAVPGSGSVFWNLQVDGVTGIVSVQQSTSADPPPITPQSVIIFRQTLTPASSADEALNPGATPDQ